MSYPKSNPSLTDTRIAFGSPANLIAESVDFTFTDLLAAKTLLINNGGGRAAFHAQSFATGNAGFRLSNGLHPGDGGGLVLPFQGGFISGGPGVWWANNDFTQTSGIFLSLGLNFQGANSTHDPFKIRKGTGSSSDGEVIFEFRPSDGAALLNPFGTGAGNTTEIRFRELLANGTSYFATKAADSIPADLVMVWPTNTPTANQALSVASIAGNVISTQWASAGGATINPTDNVLPYRLDSTTFADSPLARVSATLLTSSARLQLTGTGNAWIDTASTEPLLLGANLNVGIRVATDGQVAIGSLSDRGEQLYILASSAPALYAQRVGGAGAAFQVANGSFEIFTIDSNAGASSVNIRSGTGGISGLNFTNVNKSSTPASSAPIGLDGSGNVVVVPKGSAVLVAGTITVSTTLVTANSLIFLTGQDNSGTPGELTISARSAGASFTISSTSALDTRTVAWMIVEP